MFWFNMYEFTDNDEFFSFSMNMVDVYMISVERVVPTDMGCSEITLHSFKINQSEITA